MSVETILIDDKICAIQSIPKYNSGNTLPTILMLHGFGTSKDEVGNCFTLLSNKLYKVGIASLRIDFKGHGKSTGSTETMTIDDVLDDASVAYNYLVSQNFVDINRLGICGFSLGAGISILLSEKYSHTFKSMSIISPAGNLSDDFFKYLGKENFNLLANSKTPLEIDIGWRTISLSSQFIESLSKFNLKEAITTFNGSLFAIAGSNDFSRKHVDDYFKLCNSINKIAEIIDKEDHIFHALDPKLSKIQLITDNITKWFTNTL